MLSLRPLLVVNIIFLVVLFKLLCNSCNVSLSLIILPAITTLGFAVCDNNGAYAKTWSFYTRYVNNHSQCSSVR